jgi:hypothetical protein
VLPKRVVFARESHRVEASQHARRDILGWFWDWLFGNDSTSTFGKVPTTGQIAEAEYLSRNSNGDAASNGYNTVTVSA